MFAFALAAITITTTFDGGNLGRVETPAPDHLRCAVKGQSDQNHRNRQANWYYFRLDNLPRNEIRIDLVDLVGEYNFHPGTHAVTRNTRPVFSYDDRTWTRFSDEQVGWDDKEVRLTLRFTPAHSRMWIAHGVPYTGRNLDALVSQKSPYLTPEVLGKSVHGRDLVLLNITDPAVPESGKKVIWLMARQHAWETGTSWAAEGAVRFLLSPDAARIRRETLFKVMPVFDADGVAEGAVRFNANGYDNNRNWDTADPAVMPEIAAVKKSIFAWLGEGHRLDLFLAMHNDEATDYLEGPLNSHAELARHFVERLRARTDFHDPDSPRNSFGPEPVAKGRTAVDQDLFAERRIPAFLMELMVEKHPVLGRPRSEADFLAFGRGLAQAMAELEARPAAEAVLQTAIRQLGPSGKLGWVEFRADWCGWCRKMDRYFKTSAAAPVLSQYYQLIPVDVDKTGGADVLAKRLGSPSGTQGLPWFAIVDAGGKVLATSEGPGGNIGFPESKAEVEHFFSVLRTTAPSMTPEQLEVLRHSLQLPPAR